jgi:hypothetical protein
MFSRIIKTVRNLAAHPASFTSVRALAARAGHFLYLDAKIVETSRYSHSTDPVSGTRCYFSKPQQNEVADLAKTGYTLNVIGVRRGSQYLEVQVVDSRGREVFRFSVDPINGKAMADTLGSACMMAKPRTGNRMDAANWATVEATGKAVKFATREENDLFSNI